MIEREETKMGADISNMAHNFDSLYSTTTLLSRYQYYDEQLQHVDIYFFSNYYDLQSDQFELNGLQCRHSNWDTWKKIGQSQPFVKTKDFQVFLQTDQKHS